MPKIDIISAISLFLLAGIGVSFLNQLQPEFAIHSFYMFCSSLRFSLLAIVLGAIVLDTYCDPLFRHKIILNWLVCGSIGCIIWFALIVDNINVHFDHDKTTQFDEFIVDKHIFQKYIRYYLFTSYYISIRDWHDKMGIPIDIDVKYATYDKARVGDKIRIFIHPGYLGHEWITYKLIPK